MKKEVTGPTWSGARNGPREGGASSAALRPTEQKPEEVVVNHSGSASCAQTDGPELSHGRFEGCVAGVVVVDGVADTGWVEMDGRRFRMTMVVKSTDIQRDWVRSMVFAPGGECEGVTSD